MVRCAMLTISAQIIDGTSNELGLIITLYLLSLLCIITWSLKFIPLNFNDDISFQLLLFVILLYPLFAVLCNRGVTLSSIFYSTMTYIFLMSDHIVQTSKLFENT